MKQLLISIVSIIIIEIFTNSCANPITPTGGPKDTIPPNLISVYPEDQTLNFKEQEITLTFDEKVTAEKLKQNLIITPVTEIEYKSYVKKNTVIITFNESFTDSTTYTLNFFDGVTDITERNPVENLIIAFSTGPYIDSISVQGNVKDLFSNEPSPEFIVGLYKISDTLTFNKNKPTYFSSTLKDGTFNINNIKAGKYLIFSFKDENKNLLFDAKDETYAFLKDTLHLYESILDTISMKSVKINASALEMNSARSSGKYFEIRYSKEIINYEITNEENQFIPAKIVGEKETIRIYDLQNSKDSVQAIIMVIDSLRNNRVDTVYAKFKESSRKPEEYNVKMLPKTNSSISSATQFQLQFNKPTNILDSNFLYLNIDTLALIEINPRETHFDSKQMTLSFNFDLDKKDYSKKIDSLLNIYPIDTLNPDSLLIPIHNNLKKLNRDQFTVKIEPGSFVSIEQDTSQELTLTYKYEDPSKSGLIKLKVDTEAESYYVELMSQNQVIRENYNCQECIFDKLPPKDYWFRIKHDTNNDSIWTYGNIIKQIEPEPIYFFKEATTLRANWEVEINIAF